MKKLILSALFLLIVFQSFAGPIVIRWHGRYVWDGHKFHCVTGGGKGCVGRGAAMSQKQPQNLNELAGIENGVLEYDVASNKWFIYVSTDVLSSAETKSFFKSNKIEHFSPTIEEEALVAIDPIKFKGKILKVKSLAYTKARGVKWGNDKYIKIELKKVQLLSIDAGSKKSN